MLTLEQKRLVEQFDVSLQDRIDHEHHIYIHPVNRNMAKLVEIENSLDSKLILCSEYEWIVHNGP